MTQNIHCPMIHGGLHIVLQDNSPLIYTQQCCLRLDSYSNTAGSDIWNDSRLVPLRELNNKNIWSDGCWSCQGNELSGLTSFRSGMLEKFGERKNLSGPQRLDLMFDISCNLACRTCGPGSSTYWQRHLKENNIPFIAKSPISKVNEMIQVLKNLDLSNLEMVVFCGGETLMGNAYWQVAEAIADMCAHSKEKITINFQTNGTQPINEKYFDIIELFHLVKLNISLDGIKDRFEYLRWPANWNQVVDNMLKLRSALPVNVMFYIEQTISIFNLYYLDELQAWMQRNFHSNRLGPNKQGEYGNSVGYGNHLAWGPYGISNITEEYASAIRKTKYANLITNNWQENGSEITSMINEIKKFDAIRNQDWRKTFPEVAEFYSRYI